MHYVEQNPLRAGLVASAEHWDWSSAAARLGTAVRPHWLDLRVSLEPLTLSSLAMAEAEQRLRPCTHTGPPAGSEAFVTFAETALVRRLEPAHGGRPKKKLVVSTPGINEPVTLFAGTGGS